MLDGSRGGGGGGAVAGEDRDRLDVYYGGGHLGLTFPNRSGGHEVWTTVARGQEIEEGGRGEEEGGYDCSGRDSIGTCCTCGGGGEVNLLDDILRPERLEMNIPSLYPPELAFLTTDTSCMPKFMAIIIFRYPERHCLYLTIKPTCSETVRGLEGQSAGEKASQSNDGRALIVHLREPYTSTTISVNPSASRRELGEVGEGIILALRELDPEIDLRAQGASRLNETHLLQP